ncbi:MAG TPA: plasmid pRiA4b ORF-3 family protein [Candidatus Sulfotelmatobacter sp.]|nr:plasmid pRiA4b ORF-3 family protein [Candidatus Sulfotelmatobacter sp.]
MKKRPTGRRTGNAGKSGLPLYTLEVRILNGPMTSKFVKKNRVISRTIQVRGDQTLQQLHRAIFHAFDREEEHMYEFQIGGKGPMDPKARSYVLPMAMDDLFTDKPPAGDVTRTTIAPLGLKVNDAFGYWFDFGDDWWHQINVVAIDAQVEHGRYPRVTGRVGESPPQYVDWESEE